MPKVPLNTITSGYGTVDALNANFDAIEAAFDNTLSRDGDTPNQMQVNLDMNGFSILNQGNPITVSGFNWEGQWLTATAYQVGDVVQQTGSAYICVVAHTSGVFATDLAASRWQLVAQANLPTQTGNSGKFLTTNGTSASWDAIEYTPLGTGAVERTIASKVQEIVSVKDFGAVGNGIADDTVAIQNAINALPNDGGTVYFPAGRFKVTSTIEIGNGSNSAASTKNCIKLQGEGMGPYFGTSMGTEIFWDGAVGGGPVVRFNGSGDGFGLDRIEINANLKAATGVEIYSVRVSTFSNFAIREFTNAGLSLQIRSGPNGSVLFASGNMFSNWIITSSVAANYGIVIQGNYANNDDWHRNTFIGGTAQLPRSTSGTNYATYLEFTDSNTWIECDLNVFGPGTGFGLFLNGAANSFYPENNFFYGCSIISTGVFESGGNVIGDNFYYNFATKDMEVIPNHPKLRGITDTGKMFGVFELLNDALTTNLTSKGTEVSHIFRNNNGNARWRVMNNANDSSSVGLEFAYSTNGTTWTTSLALLPNGDVYVNMPTVGLKPIIASGPNTAGSGFRALTTTN